MMMMLVMMMVMVVLMVMMMKDDCGSGFIVASAHTSAYCGSNQSATRCDKAVGYNN